MIQLTRRHVLMSTAPVLAKPVLGASGAEAGTPQARLAAAARRQVGVTTGYDPVYRRIAYPNGDVPRSTGVCADVVIRAARDGLCLDLQRLVHEDMLRAFGAYPSRRTWGRTAPDANIDHRRVLNLETYWARAGAEIGRAAGGPGFAFPGEFRPGDLVTWRLWGKLPHVAVISAGGRIVHNIGGGATEAGLWQMALHRPVGHYRWPAAV